MHIFKFQALIKALIIIPVCVAILSFSEPFLPLLEYNTTIVNKHDSYRLKTNRTTYTIDFVNIDDQFTKEIYDQLEIGESVILHLTYFHKQVKRIELPNGVFIENETHEGIAIFAFAAVFLLSALVWFYSKPLEKTPLISLGFVIIIAIISGIRILASWSLV